MPNKLFALIAGLCLSGAAAAQVTVASPWARATVPAQKSTGAFMRLQSAKAARLVEVKSPAAVVELHQMQMNGDMMRMEQVDGIDLPAGKPVNLASGGYHLMLTQLKRQLKAGDTVPLTLVIQHENNQRKQRESVTVQVPVKPLTFSADQH